MANTSLNYGLLFALNKICLLPIKFGRLLSSSSRTNFINRANTTLSLVQCQKLHFRTYCSDGGQLKYSYVHGSSSEPLTGMTVGQVLQQTAERYPNCDAVAFSHQKVKLDYRLLLTESDRLAAGLLSSGLKQGDRLGIWSPNCIEWILMQYATARAGIILANINQAYKANEIQHALKQVEINALVMAESFRTQNYYDIIKEVIPEISTYMSENINNERFPHLKWVAVISEDYYKGTRRFCDIGNRATAEGIAFVQNIQRHLQFDQPINIQFTSGTTGLPKGVLLTHHNIVNNAKYTGLNLEYHIKKTRICAPVPLYHCFGMVLGSLASVIHGGMVVYPSPHFHVEKTLAAIQDERCTALYGTPTMFIDLLHHPNLKNFDLTSLYTGIAAGSPVPEKIMKLVASEMHLSKLTIAYGTTENSPTTFHTLPNESLERRVSTVGTIMPHTEAKVVNSKGDILPVNTPGELYIRGYSVMLGYYGRQDFTNEVIGVDRWYKTGDIAIIDESGYCKITGRLKDMIIRGGENIYPTEIENLIYRHPKVAEVQVVGVPDERLGEEIAAWVKIKENVTATKEEIIEFCRKEIAHFKVPHYVTFVTDFPMTVTGKVQKFQIRKEATKLYGLCPDDWYGKSSSDS